MTVLNRGAGGVPDVRNAIDVLEQSEPLYGFLQYRRRKIVLNYLPDDLSRLVKARTTVQFQSVLDKFSPHDTVFSIAKSSDLTESALSSACLLHAASGSITSSSSSLRRRRLMEITEDAEENATDNRDAQSPSSASGDSIHNRPYSQRSDATLVAPTRIPSKLQHSTTSDHLPPPPTTESIAPPESETTAPPERPPSIAPSVTFDDSADRPPSQRQPLPDELSRAPSESRRMSSQSSRPSIREDFASLYTPKVKRAPRPSVDSSGRPRASGNFSRGQEQRPVAALPAGVRSSPLRKFGGGGGSSTSSSLRPRSQGSTVASSSASARGSPVPAVPSLLVPPVPMSIPRPQAQSGAKSLSAVTTSGMTPEKERLMKALQQRKKQMEKRSAPNKQSQPTPPNTSTKGQDPNGEDKENQVEEKEEPNHDQDMTNNRPITIATAIPDATPATAASAIHDRSKHGTTTSTEAESGSTPDSRKETPGPCVSSEQPKPDSAVDLVVSDSEGDQPSITSPPSTTPTTTNTTATTLSVDHHNNDIDEIDEDNNKGLREEDEANDEQQERQGDEAQAETPQATGPIVENEPVPGDNNSLPAAAIATPDDAATETQAADDSKDPDGPRSPSALDDPLVEKSRTAAENNNNNTNNEIGVAPPSAELPPDSHQPVDAEATQNTPEPTPTPEDPSSVVHTSPIPIVAVESQQQHDLPAPESSDPVEQQDTLAVHRKKNRRRPLLEPIHVPTPEHSDEDNLLSDDSFMEELKSATVQEAKPVSVGSPVYQDQDNGDDEHIDHVMSSTSETFGGTRAVSNPSTTGESQLGNLHAGMGAARSVSSNYPPAAADPMSPALVARKVNVSSGISKRIKALEKFTGNRDVPATVIPPPHLAGTTSSNSLDAFRRRTSISKESGHSKSPSLSRSPSHSIVDPSTQTPPEISRDNSYSSLNNGAQAANSVSVTARIIRDGDSASPPNPSNRNSLNLHASPLTVEHGTSSPEPVPEEEKEEEAEPEERNASASASPPASSPNHAAAIPRSESQMSGTSQTKGDADEKAEKRSSRTSRIFSRMSSITSNPRRSFLGALSPSPSTKESYDMSPSEKEPEVAPEPQHQAIDIGEVNVQFPDTLLWKRRFIRVDEKGYLVLAPANVESTGRNMTKRYHLAEFRTPCLPDEDRQELPNSILLDFLDGSTLQCACESRQGQSAILDSKFFSPHSLSCITSQC